MDYRDDYDALRAQLADAQRELATAREEIAFLKKLARPWVGGDGAVRGVARPTHDSHGPSGAPPAPPPAAEPAPQLPPLEGYLTIADAYAAQQRYQEAAAAFSKVLDAEPRNERALAALGAVQLAMGDLDAGRRSYRHLLLLPLDGSSGVTKASVYLALGRIEVALGEPRKAQHLFEKGLDLAPNDRELASELARVL